MRAKDRTPTTRLLALAAFLLAAGLLSLRAYDVFGTPDAEPAGGATEREITYLLEPITGENRIRVSVTGHSPKTVLVMIDGANGEDLRTVRTRIETILSASIGFDPETDTLTLSQFPFARGVGGSMTSFEIAELTGLGLLSLILLGLVFAPAPATNQSAPAPIRNRPSEPAPQARPVSQAPQVLEPNQDLSDATALAETQPSQTADLVRDWMSYREE
jgi:flagellar biosynthesis/type III secretory pathway M-ring protein FliF/YscJ